MNRRTLLKAMSYGTLSALGGHLGWRLTDAWRAGYELPSLPESAGVPEIPLADPFADEGSAALDRTAMPEADMDRASYL